ncbi:MAG: Na+/H+ antiporter NhaC family protein [Clostridia bacterium]|nr:Na+/H+ antiporter NhaC family protein [Clostridia bacterium]
MVDCETCQGTGKAVTYSCVECEGTGSVDDATCEVCAGERGTEHTECEDCAGSGKVEADSDYYKTIMALMPPVIAIVLALVTKEVYSSLFVGIVAAGLLITEFKPIATLNTVLNDGFISSLADSWNVGILIFLVLLGIIVALVNKAGGSRAFGEWTKKHVKTKVGAQLATFVLGVLIFVDDYFNCLTVGSVMKPVTDNQKISRAKLAYIIDATAAPICMIAPISSWAAAVSGVVEGQNGLELFIKAIPYNFYSLLTIAMIIAISVMKFDYGPMKKHEWNALHGDLHSDPGAVPEVEEYTQDGKKRSLWDLVFPVVVLIACCVLGMLYSGGFFSGTSFIDAFAGCDASVALSWGAIIALVISIIYLLCRRVLTFKEAMECVPEGFKAMVPPILILTFAWTLSGLTGMLGADVYVAELMEGAAAGLTNLLPAIIFLVAVGLAFSTGTSWGTFGILIPIVVSVFASSGELLTIGISACLAGAVCGDHCSPISDTTIMSSAGANCNHINHVSTQLPYALTVAAVSFVTYIIAGFVQNWMIVLPIGLVLMIVTLVVIKSATNKKVTQ